MGGKRGVWAARSMGCGGLYCAISRNLFGYFEESFLLALEMNLFFYDKHTEKFYKAITFFISADLIPFDVYLLQLALTFLSHNHLFAYTLRKS